jgi:hypothetical protein
MSFGIPVRTGLGVGLLASTSLATRNAFSPAALFAAGEQGAWYDPSDLSTLFQDTAGTVPVTAAGQTVARVNDKSGRGNHATQATAASRPQYQIDTSGRPFLLFDGTDDFLVTPTITPGANAAQAFAGVRKLSDATTNVLLESSGVSTTNPGTIGIFAPSGAAANYNWRSQGSNTGISVSGVTFTAPITNVVTGIGDIASDVCILRVNGAQVGSTTADQGTGNYLAYPIYIGRRNGTSFPLNGRIYSLIVRFGANLTAGQISQTESWVNGKTGAY